MIKVVLVDDQRLVVEGIKVILEKSPDIQVVGVASDIASAIELCAVHEPNVVMLDTHMPSCDGLKLTAQIYEQFPGSKVIILTGHKDGDSVMKAMRSGASGYMLKNINPEELLMTIKSTAMGLSVMHKDVLVTFTDRVATPEASPAVASLSGDVGFSEREIHIIKYVVQGKENREIAMNMFLSVGTVKNTLSQILKKLQLRDRVELAVYALKNNLL